MNQRQQFIDRLKSWIGYSEANGKYREIIDIYNSIVPLPSNYAARYSDPWCAITVSAAARAECMTDVVLPECSCPRMIKLYQEKGLWRTKGYIPQEGDVIFYDWNNDGLSDHVGVVVSVNGKNLKIIEGNNNDAVGYRDITTDYKYIAGYGVPQYGEEQPAAIISVDPNHPDFTPEEFLSIIRDAVIQDMRDTGILASLTAAQALLESGRGNSSLSRLYYNLFGMKKSTDWTGKTVDIPTTEYYNGVPKTVVATWKVYNNWNESINDHSRLFLKYDRYANLRGEKDYRTACRNVQADGYATSPTYADSLIKVIEMYKLYEWDEEGFNPVPSHKYIEYGSVGQEVKNLQNFLIQNGYSCGIDGADGVVGEMTYRALTLWMYDNKKIVYKV